MTEIGDFGNISKYLKRVETPGRGGDRKEMRGRGIGDDDDDDIGKISRPL